MGQVEDQVVEIGLRGSRGSQAKPKTPLPGFLAPLFSSGLVFVSGLSRAEDGHASALSKVGEKLGRLMAERAAKVGVAQIGILCDQHWISDQRSGDASQSRRCCDCLDLVDREPSYS